MDIKFTKQILCEKDDIHVHKESQIPMKRLLLFHTLGSPPSLLPSFNRDPRAEGVADIVLSVTPHHVIHQSIKEIGLTHLRVDGALLTTTMTDTTLKGEDGHGSVILILINAHLPQITFCPYSVCGADMHKSLQGCDKFTFVLIQTLARN